MKSADAAAAPTLPPQPAWREAVAADEPAVLALLEAFYVEDHIAFESTRVRRAFRELVADAALGRVFLLGDAAGLRGYLVLTFGFSLEFGGRFVLLDELYLAPSLRGQGWGQHSLAFAESWARAQGVSALRLELNHANTRARALYLKSGFTDDCRDLFTLRL